MEVSAGWRRAKVLGPRRDQLLMTTVREVDGALGILLAKGHELR
jgi:hypothetical protein